MATEILNLAKAIEIVTAVHTSDHPRGFDIDHRASIFDQTEIKVPEYVAAWKLLRQAIGKKVAE